MVYKHMLAYLNTLLLLHYAQSGGEMKMPLKGEVGGGNYIVDHEKSWKSHGIVFFEFLWDPCMITIIFYFEKKSY